MITIDYIGGGGLKTPKIDYIILEQPLNLDHTSIFMTWGDSF